MVYLPLVALLLLTAVLWARNDHMVNSAMVPAAQGKVHTAHDHNGNTELDIQVHHLAKPRDLNPSYVSYIVWVEPRGEAPVNVGELRVGDDLKGKLKTTTPFKKFDIVVTAEGAPNATAPTGPEVLHGIVSR
jgi:hypothetical protein